MRGIGLLLVPLVWVSGLGSAGAQDSVEAMPDDGQSDSESASSNAANEAPSSHPAVQIPRTPQPRETYGLKTALVSSGVGVSNAITVDVVVLAEKEATPDQPPFG